MLATYFYSRNRCVYNTLMRIIIIIDIYENDIAVFSLDSNSTFNVLWPQTQIKRLKKRKKYFLSSCYSIQFYRDTKSVE